MLVELEYILGHHSIDPSPDTHLLITDADC